MRKKVYLNGKKIEIRLIEIDMKKGELSDAAGICRSKLSGIFKGLSCKESTALKIADALGLRLEDIADKVVDEMAANLVKIKIEKVYRILNEKDISLNNFAKMYGATRQRISTIFNSRMVYEETARKIADLLGTDVSEIIQNGGEVN